MATSAPATGIQTNPTPGTQGGIGSNTYAGVNALPNNSQTSNLPQYTGQLVNGFAPVAGYANSDPNLQAGNKLDPNALGGQSAINPTSTTYTQGQTPANPTSVNAFISSLTPEQQNNINAVSNQFGGDVLAAAKFYGYTQLNGQDNPLYTAALASNVSTGTGSASAQTGSQTTQPNSNPVTPITTNTTPTGTPATSTTPGQITGAGGTATSGTAAAVSNGSAITTPGGTDLSQKYNATLGNLQSGSATVPTTSGAGSAAVAGATPPTPAPQTQPDGTQAQVVLDNNDAYQQYIKDYQDSLSSSNQQESLTQEYTDLQNKLGLPALQTEMINMQNIINGTDNDIRNEINKAGGFATNSQVAAMAVSRNKVLTQNFNQLQQTYKDATDNVNTMIGLDEKDQAMAQTKISNQLNYDKNMIDYTNKALTNAQSSLTEMQKTEGWDGVLKAAQASGDPEAIAKINSTMGNGFDLATMASQDAIARTNAQNKDTEALAVQNSTIQKNNSDIAKNDADIRKTNDDAGVPDPAKANTPGFDSNGVKYTPASAQTEITNYWKSQQAFDPKTGYIPPRFYNQGKAVWVKNGLSATDYDSIMGQYKDPGQDKTGNKLYD